MLSKNRIKYIRSLEMKKYRKAEKAFLAEGNKLVNDLLGHFSCKLLIATAQWLEAHPLLLAQETIEVSAEELARASLLKTPQEVLAVFDLPSYTYDDSLPGHSLCLALDDVQDPGNLGTIIRIADWFGNTTKRLFPKELLSRILLTVSWMKLQNIHNTTASSPANVSATAPRKIRSSIITW